MDKGKYQNFAIIILFSLGNSLLLFSIFLGWTIYFWPLYLADGFLYQIIVRTLIIIVNYVMISISLILSRYFYLSILKRNGVNVQFSLKNLLTRLRKFIIPTIILYFVLLLFYFGIYFLISFSYFLYLMNIFVFLISFTTGYIIIKGKPINYSLPLKIGKPTFLHPFEEGKMISPPAVITIISFYVFLLSLLSIVLFGIVVHLTSMEHVLGDINENSFFLFFVLPGYVFGLVFSIIWLFKNHKAIWYEYIEKRIESNIIMKY